MKFGRNIQKTLEFSMSGLKNEKLIKKQIYTKTETCKLYSRVFRTFLPNIINWFIDWAGFSVSTNTV